jgi:hypothetical protein
VIPSSQFSVVVEERVSGLRPALDGAQWLWVTVTVTVTEVGSRYLCHLVCHESEPGVVAVSLSEVTATSVVGSVIKNICGLNGSSGRDRQP